MSSDLQSVTHVEVKDYLDIPKSGAERAATYRLRKQREKLFVSCQQCGEPLVSKWGTLRGTDDIAKAICADCKVAQRANGHKRCSHGKVREFTFSDGKTIRFCPDCKTFDKARAVILRSGPPAIPKAKEVSEWSVLLDEAGLPMSRGRQVVREYLEHPLTRFKPWFVPKRSKRRCAVPVISKSHPWFARKAANGVGAIRIDHTPRVGGTRKYDSERY